MPENSLLRLRYFGTKRGTISLFSTGIALFFFGFVIGYLIHALRFVGRTLFGLGALFFFTLAIMSHMAYRKRTRENQINTQTNVSVLSSATVANASSNHQQSSFYMSETHYTQTPSRCGQMTQNAREYHTDSRWAAQSNFTQSNQFPATTAQWNQPNMWVSYVCFCKPTDNLWHSNWDTNGTPVVSQTQVLLIDKKKPFLLGKVDNASCAKLIYSQNILIATTVNFLFFFF